MGRKTRKRAIKAAFLARNGKKRHYNAKIQHYEITNESLSVRTIEINKNERIFGNGFNF